jgi:hypothetical protein
LRESQSSSFRFARSASASFNRCSRASWRTPLRKAPGHVEELIPNSPRASEVPVEAYHDDRFVRELNESGFVRAFTER